MADASYQPKVYREQGGARQVVASGGSMDVESGGEIDIESGGAFKIAGTAVAASATELNEYCVNAYQADAGTAGSVFVVVPHAGTIAKMYATNYVANATTKTVLTAEIAGVLVTAPAWEITITQAAGTASSSVPTAANAVAAGDVIELISDGGTDATMPVMYTIAIAR